MPNALLFFLLIPNFNIVILWILPNHALSEEKEHSPENRGVLSEQKTAGKMPAA
jgi:hypothetical protein